MRIRWCLYNGSETSVVETYPVFDEWVVIEDTYFETLLFSQSLDDWNINDFGINLVWNTVNQIFFEESDRIFRGQTP
jgi:hypothetical protein